LHIDKAGESISAEVQAFCKDHGIALSTTATEQHQQNGIAERLNGIILERLTATLASLNAETPPKYWPILALSIIYLRNRSPSSVIGKTPYEAWYGQQPDLAHLRTLGAKGFVQLKRSGHLKLDPVSEHCHMLGYQGSSNYIVLQSGPSIHCHATRARWTWSCWPATRALWTWSNRTASCVEWKWNGSRWLR